MSPWTAPRRGGYQANNNSGPTGPPPKNPASSARMQPAQPGPGPVTFTVEGVPAPQGSKNSSAIKKNGQYTGRVRMYEQNHVALEAWRGAVIVRCRQAMAGRKPLDGPVVLGVEFRLARPAGHYGTGRNAGVLKDSAPESPAVRPDLDKLTRATLDALTMGGAYTDDSRVVGFTELRKVYADGVPPGAVITVQPA